jgi:UDP-N-acetylmuramoyl-L-alanyl-D-glutamate--2,6-diaminopimelate ligase
MPALSRFLVHLPDAHVHTTAAGANPSIHLVTADSRTVQPGALFVVIRGERVDGHRFLPQVAADGAVAAIGTESPTALARAGLALPENFPYVQVEDSRRALAICSAVLHDFPSRAMAVIGVTGTDGKTSTCSILESILAAATRTGAQDAGRVGVITTVAARIRGQENDTGFHVTTPDAPVVQQFLAQMRNAGCDYAIVESTSHGLAQGRVAAVDFDIAAVTNITHEHIDWHGSRANYVAAKALLFRVLHGSPAKPGIPRCAVLNADDAGSFGALQHVLREEADRHAAAVPVRTYGIPAPDAAHALDVAARHVVCEPGRTRFVLQWWNGEFALETHLLGEFNVYNILCAATVSLSLGIDPEAIQQGVRQFAGVSGRMERIDCGQPFLAVVDFAHSPASLERALETLRTVAPSGRLISVFGSAGLRDVEKRGLMGRVSGRLADFTVITAEDPRTEDLNAINQAIASGVLEHAPATAFTIVPDRARAIQAAVDMAQPGDVVAAFGKGHERSMCFGETEYPWSDQEAMRNALQMRMARESI